MSPATSAAPVEPAGPSLWTRIAAVAVLLALAALAAYAMFSGPTKVQPPSGASEARPGKTAPAAPAEEGPGEREGDRGR